MEKSRGVYLAALVLGWLHFVAFSALIVATFLALAYSIFYIFENKVPIQNIVIVLMISFAGFTIFGIFDYAAGEFVKALKYRDHSRMLMFKMSAVFLFACGFGVFCCGLYRLYKGLDLTEKNMLACLIGGTSIMIFEFVVFIVAQLISGKFRFEARRHREEKYRKRKMNAVSQQMSNILQPIDMECGTIEEKSFERRLVEKRRIAFEELRVEDIEKLPLPPPPEHF